MCRYRQASCYLRCSPRHLIFLFGPPKPTAQRRGDHSRRPARAPTTYAMLVSGLTVVTGQCHTDFAALLHAEREW